MRSPIDKLFCEHPASVGESYFEHLVVATCFSARLASGAIGCFIHGVFPFLCSKTGSNVVAELYGSMLIHRSRKHIGEPSELPVDRDKEVDARS